MNLREATDDDVDAVRRVAERSWEADYPDIVSRETASEGVEQWYGADRVREELARAETALLVAEGDGEVVGFAHAVWGGEEGTVLRLYVDPDHRRAGVGGELLEATVARLREEGVDRVKATVLAENDPGNAFYEAHGFEREPRTQETEIAGERHEEHVWVRL
jgi:ribosomal protein S18 acetylase RimI-like enzyme